MKYAVIFHSGKQYKVAEGETVDVDFMSEVKPEATLSFDQVLLVVDEGKKHIGTPTVKGAVVTATVVNHKKEPKIRVAKYKAKVRYRKVTGHRAKSTTVKIDKISAK